MVSITHSTTRTGQETELQPSAWDAEHSVSGIYTGTADPTADAGVAHTMPAIYLRNNAGTVEIWLPTGTGATAWAKMVSA